MSEDDLTNYLDAIDEWDQMLEKCRDAARGGFGPLSLGEKCAAALVCNRPDWLHAIGYTIPEALERIGEHWASRIPEVAQKLRDEGNLPAFDTAAWIEQTLKRTAAASQADIDALRKF
jgi:hypothetical protein